MYGTKYPFLTVSDMWLDEYGVTLEEMLLEKFPSLPS